MHMRKKPWSEPELRESGLFIEDAAAQRSHWQDIFPSPRPMELEVGCGKCRSTAAMAKDNPDTNYLAVDEARIILGVACRTISGVFEGQKPDNLRLASFDVLRISDFIAPEDRFERIHIHFCNPWNRKLKQHKRRLTHTRQLVQYLTFLADGGEIRFKTDDLTLFDASIEYFNETGFEITYLTRDLHASDFSPNYESEHEQMYSAKGMPIYFLIARKPCAQ